MLLAATADSRSHVRSKSVCPDSTTRPGRPTLPSQHFADPNPEQFSSEEYSNRTAGSASRLPQAASCPLTHVKIFPGPGSLSPATPYRLVGHMLKNLRASFSCDPSCIWHLHKNARERRGWEGSN
ncbi:hypothetical protein LZ31DRAFT_557159 [Colletotrichum somersetense]|nr:hypothetical protein LZ31DRAFT_557159 [Colletotrichum somersetense]